MLYNIIKIKVNNTTHKRKAVDFMDTRKLDMIFFMVLENNNKELTFDEIQNIAKNYSARSIWYLWQHRKRYNNYIKSL